MWNWLAVFGAMALVGAACPASAQNDRMTAIVIPAQPDAIPLDTGAMPDTDTPESWHMQYGSVFARNVRHATLTPFLPHPDIATGAAVIVAPGGGFRTLSMENEGWDVARALAERGVAAFVLKYRLNQTPADLATFASAPPPAPPAPAEDGAPSDDPRAYQTRLGGIAPMIADARAAFALVRSNREAWNVDADRIGMVGFSAGAMLTMATALDGVDAKPAFIGNIYGPLSGVDVPADAPPLFVALAADDPLFPQTDFGLIRDWRAANRPVEFHYYEQGGHGFGMYDKTTTSTGWFEAFAAWLTMRGYM